MDSRDLQYVSKRIDRNVEIQDGKTATVSILHADGKKYAFKKYLSTVIKNIPAMETHICSMFDGIASKKYESMMLYGAFPRYLVKDGGRFCGFIMDAIPEDCYSLDKEERSLGAFWGIKKEINNYSCQSIGKFVKRLAKVILSMHEDGFILGDVLSENNIFIRIHNEELFPYIVDTDSIRKNKKNPSEIYNSAGYEPPEGSSSISTKSTDIYKFCLIVLRLFSCPPKAYERASLLYGDPEAVNSLNRIQTTLGKEFKNFVFCGLTDEPNNRPTIQEAFLAFSAKEDKKSAFAGLTSHSSTKDKYTSFAQRPKLAIVEDYGNIRDVEILIDSIGIVTWSSESGKRISAARSAYKKLSSEQKRHVANYEKLSQAEKRYAKLTGFIVDLKLYKNAFLVLGIMIFAALGGFIISLGVFSDKSSNERYLKKAIKEINAGMTQGIYEQVIFGYKAIYCLNNDGTISVYAVNQEKDKAMEETYSTWANVNSITVLLSSDNTKETLFGITDDGKVLTPVGELYEEIDVNDWTDVVQLDTSLGWLMAVTADGTVLSSREISKWDGNKFTGDISQIACVSVNDDKYYMGLTKDGRIISLLHKRYYTLFYDGEWTAFPYQNLRNVTSIVICPRSMELFALNKFGDVYYCGALGSNSKKNILEGSTGSWENVTAISAGEAHIVALLSDGTVLSHGNDKYNQCNVNEWKNIVRVEAFGYTTVGYSSDGIVYYCGYNCLEAALERLQNKEETTSSTVTTQTS